MKLAKEFKNQIGLTSRNPEIAATTVSSFLKKDWQESVNVVNEQQSGVVLYKSGWVSGALIPPSFVYEYHRLFPTRKFSYPVLHVSEKKFKNNFDDLIAGVDDFTTLVVLDQNGAPLLSYVNSIQANFMLSLDENNKMCASWPWNSDMFTVEEPYDIGKGWVHDKIKLSKDDIGRLNDAIDALTDAPKNRDSMHDAVRSLRFDID